MTSIQHLDPDESIEPLPEDNDPPFSEPTSPVSETQADPINQRPAEQPIDPTHPATDSASNLDTQEAYDAGEAAAANVPPPSENAVTGYNPSPGSSPSTNTEQQPQADDDQEDLEDIAL